LVLGGTSSRKTTATIYGTTPVTVTAAGVTATVANPMTLPLATI
jgi:hypothetical protein